MVCDEVSGWKAGFANGITEAGVLAHARRKFLDMHVSNRDQFAEQALGITRMPGCNDNNPCCNRQPDNLAGVFCKRYSRLFYIRHRQSVGVRYRA